MGEGSQRTGAGLSIEIGNGISPGNIHQDMGLATSSQPKVGSHLKNTKIARVQKKTGLDSQGVTEKPGEFSNLVQQ